MKLVSVCMITYNHASYISEAIESIMNQRTDFQFELVIGDDCSTDNTTLICEEWQQKYPSKIYFINRQQNIGMANNFADVIKKCTGKYIAICEGDDYWIDEYKLQKQTEFLESNPDFAICFSRVEIKYENTEKSELSRIEKDVTTIYDLAKGNYIYTPSCFYRNHLFEKFPEVFFKAPACDYFLHMLNARFGKIKFLESITAVYRVHDGGIWGSKHFIYRSIQWINLLDLMIPEFDKELQNLLIESRNENTQNIAHEISKELNQIEIVRKYMPVYYVDYFLMYAQLVDTKKQVAILTHKAKLIDSWFLIRVYKKVKKEFSKYKRVQNFLNHN